MSTVYAARPSIRMMMAAIICALVVPLVAGRQVAPAVVGLDHVTIGVNDLERAADQYRRLGFSLKPGQPHANGIRNEHAKFPDGTELELITAPESRDALTAAYRRHLARGDGPAFFALFVPDRRRTPPKPKVPLDYLFFGGRNASPTDRPEHFAHPNTAESLIAVWIAADDVEQERRLFESYGARVFSRHVDVPARTPASIVRFREGEVVLLPGPYQRVAGRRVIGVTLRVGSVEKAAAVLARERIKVERSSSTPSLFVPPASAHGLWIELRPPS